MDYWNIYKDVWIFHKKYSDVKGDDGYWQSAMEEAQMILDKYDNCPFVMDLLHAVLSELELVCKSLAG